MRYILTFTSANRRKTFEFASASRTLGEYVLGGLQRPAFKTKIHDSNGKTVVLKQLIATVNEATSFGKSARIRCLRLGALAP